MNVAPAFAASSAWAAEKHKVTLTIAPSPVSALQALRPAGRQRHLDRDIVGDLPQHCRLAHHPVVIERDDLGGNRAADDRRDFAHDLEEIAAGLVDSEGLVVTPSSKPGFGELADFGDFGGVGEEFHGLLSVRISGMDR